MKIMTRTLLICSLSVLLISAGALAQTTVNSSWNGVSQGWSNGSLWLPVGVPNTLATPGNIYNVKIDNGGAPVVDQNIQINSLSIGATTGQNSGLLDTNGVTLTVEHDTANNGVIVLSGGSNLAINGNLTNSGEVGFELNGSTTSTPSNMTVGGTLTNTGTLDLNAIASGVADTLVAGTLVSAGDNTALIWVEPGTTATATEELDLTGGEIRVQGSLNGLNLIKNFTGGELLLVNQNASITPAFNSGTLNVGGSLVLDGSSLSVTGNVANSGAIESQKQFSTPGTASSFNASGTLTNSGIFSLLDPGDSATVGELVNTGRFVVLPGTSVTLTNEPEGVADIPSGAFMQIEGPFNAGSNSAFDHLESVEGGLLLQNGEAINDAPASGTLTIGPASGTNGSINETNPWTVNGNLDNKGFLNDGGPLIVTGNFNNESGAQFGVGNTATIDGVLTNSGAIHVGSGATLNTSNGFTTIATGSEFDLQGSFNAGGHAGLTSLGEIDGALGIANGQSNTITPSSGTLQLNGALYVGSGTTLTINGNLKNDGEGFDNFFNQLSLTNYGTLTVTGDLTNSALFNVAGTINAGSFENSSLLEAAAGSLPSVINVAGAFTQTAGAGPVTTFLTGQSELISASTVNIQANQFQVTELSANTLNISSGGTVMTDLATVGGTPIAPGTLASNNSLLTIASNGTLVDNGSLSFFYAATVNNAGTVTIGATGTLDTGGGTYNQSAGSTDVNGTLIANVAVTGGALSGSGKIQGSLSVTGGTIQPSDPLSITGNFTLGSNGTLAEDITSGADFGALDVSGAANVAGTLDIALLGNFLPTNGEQFVILDAMGGLSGIFSTIDGLHFGPGNADNWSISYAGNKIMLTVNVLPTSPTPEPASFLLFGTGLLGLSFLVRKTQR